MKNKIQYLTFYVVIILLIFSIFDFFSLKGINEKVVAAKDAAKDAAYTAMETGRAFDFYIDTIPDIECVKFDEINSTTYNLSKDCVYDTCGEECKYRYSIKEYSDCVRYCIEDALAENTDVYLDCLKPVETTEKVCVAWGLN